MVLLRFRLGSYLVQVSALRLAMVQIGLVLVQIVCGLTLYGSVVAPMLLRVSSVVCGLSGYGSLVVWLGLSTCVLLCMA